MKRRIWYAALMAAMILGLLSGCGSSPGGSDVVPGVEGKILNIYVWNDEFQGKFNANYPEIDHLSNDKSVTFLKDGTEIHWVINPTQDGVYQQKLDEALLKQDRVSADERVDMYLVEADYALKYIDPEANVAMPISQLGITDADIANQYRYTLEAMRTADGEIRGLSYQATPGMLVYRRSIAKAVLGTDDPETVAAAVSDWDKFYETAERMKDAGYYMYSGRADTYRVYSNNVSSPWVKNDKTVVVDPNMMRWVERSLEDTRSGINHNVPGQWIDEWNKDMGPDILRSLAVNNGEMSNDQPLMEELAQSPDFGIELLGGQNYLGVLSEVAANIDLSNISSYDQGCVEEFQNTFGDYFNGKISLEKAKANFEMSITERYPWLVGGGVEWP